MTNLRVFQWLADAVLLLHVSVAAFVVGGLILIVAGNKLGWPWVNCYWFRFVHLGAILAIMAETWLGVICPLTTLEMWLRVQAQEPVYAGSFIEHWLQRLLYYDAPPWVFALAYTVFGVLVLAVWLRYPPRIGHRDKQ